MSPSDPVLTRFATDLRETLTTGDSARLSEYLSGRYLPALGNDLTPADVIRLAIASDPGTTTRLAGMLAEVLRLEWDRFGETRKLDARGRFKLRNIYALASDLPTHAELFNGLIHTKDFIRDREDLNLPFYIALAYQQVNASLEAMWLVLLRHSYDNEASLTLWRGLLWIPPAEPSSDIIDFDRIEKGLLLLHESRKNSPDRPDLLRYALEILCETYPRSSRFWEASLHLRVGNWPEDLQEEVFGRWPLLRTSSERATRYRLLAG